MDVKVDLKPRIVVGGKEYASIEEMPPDVRKGYEKALKVLGGLAGFLGATGALSHVALDAEKMAALENLPPEIREKIEIALGRGGAVPAASTPAQIAAPAEADSIDARPIEPGGSSLRANPILVAAILIAGLLGLAVWVLIRGAVH